MSVRETMRRETRVALSLKAQPVRFRVAKWLVLLSLGALLWRTRWFWHVVVGAIVVAIALHLLWRHKTQRWTRPWGGWDDLDAGRRD